MNAFTRDRLELGTERDTRSPEPQEQPSDLYQTLVRAVAAGRRRGFGRRGRCIGCGATLQSHFSPTRNEFMGCQHGG